MGRAWEERRRAQRAEFQRKNDQTESLSQQLQDARAENARLREAVGAVEWVEGAYDASCVGVKPGYKYFGTLCPWCKQGPHIGHRPECQRQAALRGPAND